MENSISVIIPLYNHEKYIEEAVKSVINQTVAPAEIIVINDGSTDNSHAVMERLSHEYTQINYFFQHNQGAHAAINAAIAKASSKYVAILNSDDLYYPNRLQTCLEHVSSNPNVDIVVTAIQGIDEQGQPIELVWCNYYKMRYQETGDLFLALVDGNFFFTTSNIFIKRSIFDEVGNFSYFRYAHDLDFFLRLITYNKKISFIDEPLLMYRIHGSNTISEDHLKVFLERDAIVAFHLYARISDGNLLKLEQEKLSDIITNLAESGRLETVFYYFCYYLNHRSHPINYYPKSKDFHDPDFYEIPENPPDFFTRLAKTVIPQQASIPLSKPLSEMDSISETEFQRLGKIAVIKIGDKLKNHPLLAMACVKIMQGTWDIYRQLLFGMIKKSHKYTKPAPINLPQSFSNKNLAGNESILLSVKEDSQILFISHDAGRTGAPIVLLNLLRWIKQHVSLNFKIVLRGGGELSTEFMKLGPTLMLSDFDSSLWKKKLHDFIRDSDIKVIYSNTAVNGDVIDHLKSIINVPVISVIHELEHSIQRFAAGRLFDLVKKHTTLFIAVSNAVKSNLEFNHAIPSAKIQLIHSFVSVAEITQKASIDLSHIRQELSLNKGMFVVGGCGTTDWRKGADLFVFIAMIFLKMLTVEEQCRVKFVWVGGDLDSPEMLHLTHDINCSELLRDRVIFTGIKQEASPYFSQFDVFLLSSREDPFPLVCLEAGALGKPVICFDKAGGTPGLVRDDGGFVVPYLDLYESAHAISRLFHDPKLLEAMGKCLADKVYSQYDIEIGARKILSVINQFAWNIHIA